MPVFLQIEGTVTVLQPLTHVADSPDDGLIAQGNQLFHRKMKVFTSEGPVLVPVISGNSIRGIMRRLGAAAFLEMVGLDGDGIPPKLKHLLFAGGSLEEGRKGRRQTADREISPTVPSISELQRRIPLLSLLGCSYRQQMLQSKLIADFLVPCVDEIAELHKKPRPGIQSYEITGWLFYTRTDEHGNEAPRKSHQMIYRMEYVVPGTVFLHGFTLIGTDEIETALFFHLLELLTAHGRLGGKIRQGHGAVRFEYNAASRNAVPYMAYVKDNKPAIVDFLRRTWDF
ncbi:MAG TPA: RAMP superfamily CRISPR-associated protein [Paenibacillus sp.]|uniref:RAMP superfamily CRISPR-associated protein n=1 Tax=Paenibacillus sp. TaxID=58172 RepID=UPI002CC6C64C|nr:RAMP superfamily CRISPR-associated protein [Paenibacillus sp.]HUC92080.1 RAMP superfamily CRISPR-associated protein [Paenibacillus sp.]